MTIFFLTKSEKSENFFWKFLSTSLSSYKVEKRTVPHFKAWNLINLIYFIQFWRKTNRNWAMIKNICDIFFGTVSRIGNIYQYFIQKAKISKEKQKVKGTIWTKSAWNVPVCFGAWELLFSAWNSLLWRAIKTSW